MSSMHEGITDILLMTISKFMFSFKSTVINVLLENVCALGSGVAERAWRCLPISETYYDCIPVSGLISQILLTIY